MLGKKKHNEKEAGIKLIPVGQIREPENPDRSVASEEKLRELAQSIKELGVLLPLIVCKEGEEYVVVAGHRRLLAARQAGLVEVPCRIISRITEKLSVRYHENAFRENLNVWDDAAAIARFIQAHPKLSQKDVAKKLGRSPAYISQRLAILQWPNCLTDALHSGAIAFSVARELSRITDADYLESMVQFAVRDGCTPATARIWVQNWENSLGSAASGEPASGLSSPEDSPAPIYFCEVCRETIKNDAEAVTVIMHTRCRNELIAALKAADK